MLCQSLTPTSCSSCLSNRTTWQNTVTHSEVDAMSTNISANRYLETGTDTALAMTREKLLSIISTVMDILDQDDGTFFVDGSTAALPSDH